MRLALVLLMIAGCRLVNPHEDGDVADLQRILGNGTYCEFIESRRPFLYICRTGAITKVCTLGNRRDLPDRLVFCGDRLPAVLERD